MADAALQDGPAPNTPSSGDPGVPPLSAGSAAPSAPGLEARADLPVVSEELKARLDKVIYSEVKRTMRIVCERIPLTYSSIDRGDDSPDSIEAKRCLCQSTFVTTQRRGFM